MKKKPVILTAIITVAVVFTATVAMFCYGTYQLMHLHNDGVTANQTATFKACDTPQQLIAVLGEPAMQKTYDFSVELYYQIPLADAGYPCSKPQDYTAYCMYTYDTSNKTGETVYERKEARTVVLKK